MNDDLDLERRIAAWLDDQFPAREPDGLLRGVLETTSQHRPRPSWRARLGGQHFSLRRHPGRASARPHSAGPGGRRGGCHT